MERPHASSRARYGHLPGHPCRHPCQRHAGRRGGPERKRWGCQTSASQVAADVDAAHAAVTADPPRLPDASAALTVAKGHLADVVRDPLEAQALASAERSRASGDASGADAAILALASQARTDAADLAALRQRAAQAEAARDAAQAALIRAGEQERPSSRKPSMRSAGACCPVRSPS